LGAEVKGHDVSFLLLFGLAVLLIAGFWIANHPQWAWFGLLSKLMSIAVGAWFAVFGCLLALTLVQYAGLPISLVIKGHWASFIFA